MSEEGLERDDSFLTEVWVLYGIGMAILFLRLGVRLKTVGIRGLQLEDLFAFLVMIMYTCDAATVHLVYLMGSNVEAAVFQTQRTLTPDDIRQFTDGSKLQITAWYSYTALLWCLKGTMLCFFKRMSTGLWQSRLIKWLGWACVVSYIAVVITITFGCFPTEKNWQVVPDPGSRCTFRMQNFLVTVVFNVLTDAALLCIPLPLLWTLQIPVKRKIVIGLLICSGFFVIAAAIIRVVLTLGSSPSGTNINRWGVRETIVGIISVNIPILRPMFTKSFWTGSTSYASTLPGVKSTGVRSKTLDTGKGPYEMTGSITDGRSLRDNDSEEHINRCGANDIHVETVLDIKTETIRGAREEAWDRRSVKGTTANAYGSSHAV
ncbi:hypothetical protein B0I35DRAFT_514219 [Stachybotrys elegans]|uniref:Rhodopsin domain-containing protein n=1 Tax=Stachybotrys elegans TaxID=80388 RepID=A0A8K0SL45_9HYPO|nr:hypothetical protein B0I35DRAFT_514219 [Stachybotrys elegans]